MENVLSNKSEKEIVDSIKNIILKYFPIVDNRAETLLSFGGSANMEILFEIARDEGKDCTLISFYGQKATKMVPMPETIEMDGVVTTSLLRYLVDYLIVDHEVISNFDVNPSELLISMDINFTNDTLKGINCDQISIVLRYPFYPDKEKYSDELLNFFALNYLDKLKNTTYFSSLLNRYFRTRKENFIIELGEKGLKEFVNMLSIFEFKDIIMNMDNERFNELETQYNDRRDSLKLAKKMI